MNIRLLPALVVAAIGLSAQANAERVYYLVGLRHIYSIPFIPDPHVMDRQAIEEDYSAAVSDAQKHFDTDMASIHDEEAKDGGNVHQVDRDAVQQNLEQEVGEAADKREARLSQLYVQCDYVRASHPQFAVDQDGPYHVIGVETGPTGEYVNVVYYQPYPLYVDVCPFGWYWGRPYPFATFGIEVGLFHSTWISIGSPVFAPMCYGGVVFAFNAPVREAVIINRSAWVGGRPPMISPAERSMMQANRAAQVKAGVFRPGVPFATQSHTVARVGTTAASVSKYSRTGSSSARYGAAGSSANRYDRPTSPGASSSSSSASRYGRTGTTGSATGSSGSTSHSGRPGSYGSGSSAGVSKYAHSGSSSSSSRSSSSSSHSSGGSSGPGGGSSSKKSGN